MKLIVDWMRVLAFEVFLRVGIVVAVVERGAWRVLLWFCDFFFDFYDFLIFFVDFVIFDFFLHIAKVNFYGYMGFVDFVYSQGSFL